MRLENGHSMVAAEDWTRAGYKDGLHGNGRNPPSGPGSAEARKAYITGYQSGVAARPSNVRR